MPDAAPRISVVLPTYNHLRYLPDAVADIEAQTFADWELIVVDDGSTDDTRAWLGAHGEERLRVIHQPNAGPHAAINTGMRAARGAFVTWVSADNRAAPHFLAALYAALQAQPDAALAYSPYYAIDAADRVIGLKADNWLLLRELVTGTPRGITGFLYRRAVHETVGWYEGFSCDTRMWAQITQRFGCVFVLEPTVSYRFHDDRASVRQRHRIEDERAALCREFLHGHGGAVDVALLHLLYPGLGRAPHLLTDAAADFAFRLMRCNQAEPGLRLALEAVGSCDAGRLLRPLAAAAVCAARLGREFLDPIWGALCGNSALSAAQRDAALGTVSGLADIMPDALLLDAAHPLTLLERPRTFSYTAWQSGGVRAALPAF